ncbi:MAG: TolC family protein [Sulfurovum sp.]
MKKLLFFSLLSLSLTAQTLSMQACVDQTLAKHPDIKIFILKIAQSEENYAISRSDYLPQIALLGEYSPQRTYVMPQLGQFNTIEDDGWSIGTILKQKIWDFSKTTSLIEASQIDKHIAALSLEDAKAVMTYKIKSLYALMAVQHEAIDVRQKDTQSKEELYKQTLGFYAQGLRTKADVSRFEAAYQLAKEELILSQVAFDKSRNTMSLYTKIPIKKDVRLDTTLIKAGTMTFKNTSAIKDRAFQDNHQIKIASKQIEKNQKLHQAAKANHFGSIDAIGSYTQANMINRYDTNIIGISLNIPLYSGGRLSAEEQRMQIETTVAKEQLASQSIALEEELENLFLDLESYQESTKAKKTQLTSAKEAQKVLNARYKEGLSTYIEVLDAAFFLLNAQLGLLEVGYKKRVTLNRIEYLTGKIQ